MNRTYSTLAVLLLGLIAIGICLRETVEVSESLGSSTTAILIFVQAVAALGILVIGYSLMSNSLRPRRVAVARPLRRLLSAVWS